MCRNTHVKRGHALAGALFATLAIELAKKLLAIYIAMVPTYSAVYGAFATLPILLVWIYMAWVIVLLGAVVAAYLPSLMQGVARRGGGHGWQFQLALEVLQQLERARPTARRGLSSDELAHALQVDVLQLEPVLETLTALEWLGRLNEVEDEAATRYLLLADPDATLMEPLVRHLLLAPAPANANLLANSRLGALTLRQAL
jgi:membrane protein